MARRAGWRVAEVVQILGLSRRDVQRSCYGNEKNGGVGILHPRDSTWGRRTYQLEDLSKLLIVKLFRDEGKTLREIKGLFDSCEREHGTCLPLLDGWMRELDEREGDAEVYLGYAKLLRHGLEERGTAALARDVAVALGTCIVRVLTRMYIEGRLDDENALMRVALSDIVGVCYAEVGDAFGAGEGPVRRGGVRHLLDRLSPDDVPPDVLDEVQARLLSEPGIDLAIDLWQGAGSYECELKEI